MSSHSSTPINSGEASNEPVHARGILFNEMHQAAVQIVAAYASSDNADPEKIPGLFKNMIKVQVDIVSAPAKAIKVGSSG